MDGSEDRFVGLLENLQVGVVIQGVRGQVLFANAAALEILGLLAEEILGQPSLAVGETAVREDGTPFPSEDHPGARALATGQPVRGLTMGVRHPRRKERVWLLVNADPERSETDQVGSVVCTFVDITPLKRAELRLRDNEARYRQLVEKAQDIIYVTDVKGFFTYANPAASSLMGYAAPELVGKHFTDLVREDHRQRVADFLVNQYRQRLPTTYDEFPVLPRDGRELWLGQNVQLIMGDGHVVGFQAVARDITQRKRAEMALEREREQLLEIVNHAPVAMAILDRDLRYVAHSGKWPRLWGLMEGSLVGRAHLEVVPRLPPRHAEALHRALGGEVVSKLEDGFELRDGSLRYVSWTLHPWRAANGGVVGVVAAVQNVDALVRARQAAEEASRLKSEFLANVSHELRTPLGQVIALSGLLEQTSLDDRQRQWVEHVRAASGEVLERIDDILHFARLEAEVARGPASEFAPGELVEGLMAAFSPAAAAKGLRMVTEVAPELPARLVGEPEKLRRLLEHLLANAIKFTDAGQVALRALEASANDGETILRLEVEDTGVGIAPELQRRLFQPFTQADGSASRRHGGTGLGLALAHRLARSMGGELSLVSRPDRGSTFSFTALFERVGPPAPEVGTAASPRAADAAQASSPAAAAVRPETDAPYVLVVEDNAINRKVVLAMLDKLGYRGEAVGNGLEAVEACTRTVYDAVLMDCMMPEMDGYRATAWIRQREGGARRTPIVALTASTAPGDREKCFAAGMDAYLSKPVSLRVLDETLRRWVQPVAAEHAGDSARSAAPSRLAPEHPLRVLEAQGRREAVLEIIDLFLETTPLRLERLAEVARERDLASLLSLAHSLRGAALQLGARGLAERCAELQEACRNGQSDKVPAALQSMTAEYEAMRVLLEDERTRLAPPPG